MSRTSRFARPLALGLVVVAVDGCIASPQTEAKRQEQLLAVGDAINEIRNINDEMRITLDSLRTVVAKQDSTIVRMANVTGVVIAK